MVLFDIKLYFEKRIARKTKDKWYPKIENGPIKFVDVSKLTTAQLAVYFEDIKKE